MNLKNKLKLSLIIAGVITSVNTNAQTFYQCVPEECPNGQYFNGAKCLALPTQQEVKTCPTNSTFHDGKCCKHCVKDITSTNEILTSNNYSQYIGTKAYLVPIGCSGCGSIQTYNHKISLAYGDCVSYKVINKYGSQISTSQTSYCCNTCTE